MPVDIGARINPIIARLPEDEQVDAVQLAGNLVMLQGHCQNLAAAVGLIDYTDSLRPLFAVGDERIAVFDLWNQIACRDGVMSIYHAGELLEAIRRTKVSACLIDKVDGPRIRAAAKAFEKLFPAIRQMRNGVGHVAEMTSSLGGHRKHALEGSVVFGALMGRAYTITNDHEHHTLTLAAETVESLKSVVREVHAAHAWLYGALPAP